LRQIHDIFGTDLCEVSQIGGITELKAFIHVGRVQGWSLYIKVIRGFLIVD
jgi:hypothetical protein